KYVQFPLVPLQRTPMEYRDLRQLVTYYSKVGAVELRYSDTMLYVDGI
ncbi:major capsid family protein, partial [Pantoea ananatis]